MPEAPPIWQVALLILCLAASFLLSGMEAGVFALSRLRIRQVMRTGSTRARILQGYLDNTEDFLWAILIGNTLANVISVALLTTWLESWIGENKTLFWFVFLAMGFVFFLLFELLPKTVFHRFPNRLCLILARPFRWVEFSLRPLVRSVSWATKILLAWSGGKIFTGRLFSNREELGQFMAETPHGLTPEEQAMVLRVLDLRKVFAGQVMTNLGSALTTTADVRFGDLVIQARERPFGWIPVWADPKIERRIIGVLPFRRLLYSSTVDPGQPVAKLVQSPLFVGESSTLDEVLRAMQRTGQRIAIVRDRHGVEAGLVALTDILKAIFGEVNL